MPAALRRWCCRNGINTLAAIIGTPVSSRAPSHRAVRRNMCDPAWQSQLGEKNIGVPCSDRLSRNFAAGTFE
jgi:hypothetical protein